MSGATVSPARGVTADLICAGLAIVSGLAIGWLDLHTTEVIVTVVPLLFTGMLLGTLRPRAVWRWAVLIALGLPAMAAVAMRTGMHTAEPARLDVRITLVALAFALLGCYAGAAIRRLVASARSRSSAG